jgi:hypothetical protein
MTLRGFLTWYLGAVLFVGTAGATGYQVLARHQAEVAARELAPQVPDTGPIPTMVAAEFPAVNAPPSAVPSTPYNLANATPLPHSRVAKSGARHAAQSARPAERRPATRTLAARRPAAPPRHVPPPVTGQYVAPAQPVWVYVQAPAPAGAWYVYPGYTAYRPGYAYYHPRYYYRVY